MSTQICNPCAEGQVCLDNLDRYSLQDDVYYFVLNCPPNFFCGGNNVMYLVCCDGTIEQTTFTAGMTAAQRQAAISALVGRCMMKEAFCDGDGGPGGGGGDGTNGDTPGNDPNNPLQLYGNRPMSSTSYCADGSPFTYTVPAGLFFARTQAAADAAARNFARTLSSSLKICLTGPLRTCCNNVAYSSTMVASGGVPGNFRWAVIGSLPTGLVAIPIGHNGLRIQGTPTTNGNYTFTVRATDAAGNFMTKVITIKVWGITDATLPNGVFAADYTHQLTSTNGTAPYTYSLVTGVFPMGVDLYSNGLIDGIVGEEGAFPVTIRVVDSVGRTCVKNFTMTVPANVPTVCAYYTLDEVAGNRFDSVANLEWTYADAPGTGNAWLGSTPGIYGNAVRCYTAAAGSAVAQLTAINQAQLATTGNGWSMFGWFKRISPNVGPVGLTWRNDFTGSYWTITLLFNAGLNQVRILDADSVSQTLSFAATTGDWHFFHIFFSTIDQRVYFQLDNGAATNITNPSNVPAGDTGDIYILANADCSEVYLDEVGFKCDAQLTPDEVTYLYNAGAGKTWPLT